MSGKNILADQVIHVKRGRSNGLGFEPCFNSYFDFYLNSKYFGEPLLKLEDVTLHLYLRKNLNDKNKNWKMPTLRQMMAKFGISQKKLMAILNRLAQAHLLVKESGVRGGMNTRNDYLLSDPIPTLTAFLAVAAEGLFRLTLLPEYMLMQEPEAMLMQEPEAMLMQEPETMALQEPEETPLQEASEQIEEDARVSLDDTRSVLLGDTPGVSPSNTYKQTLNKQTLAEPANLLLEELRNSIPEPTFKLFVDGVRLVAIEGNTAVIGTPRAYAVDWLQCSLANKVKRLFKVEAMRCIALPA